MTAFKVIPWADVVSAAPTVVKGAKKLWSSVKTEEADAPPQEERAAQSATPESEVLSALDGRLHMLDRRIGTLGKEVVASSELISSLAEQNSRLVAAVEILRLRTRVLMLWCMALGIGLLALAAWMLVR
jgi:hypothetical protein